MIWPKFAENCVKMKKIGPGARSKILLDPPPNQQKDFGRKCSHVYFSEDNTICDPEITDNVVFYLEDIFSRSKSYTFVVLANVDTTGHGNGWCDTEYNDAVATMDSQVRTDFGNT